MKKMYVDKLGIDLLTHDPVIILKDESNSRYLPILIGPFEATAIALALEGSKVPRPLSHDLMVSIIEELGAIVKSVNITEIKNNTFYSTIVLEKDDKTFDIDSRPSDAIAIALRTKAPIYIADHILIEESISQKKGNARAEEPEANYDDLENSSRDREISQHDRQMLRKYIDSLKPSDFLKALNTKDEKDDSNENNSEEDDLEEEEENDK